MRSREGDAPHANGLDRERRAPPLALGVTRRKPALRPQQETLLCRAQMRQASAATENFCLLRQAPRYLADRERGRTRQPQEHHCHAQAIRRPPRSKRLPALRHPGRQSWGAKQGGLRHQASAPRAFSCREEDRSCVSSAFVRRERTTRSKKQAHHWHPCRQRPIFPSRKVGRSRAENDRSRGTRDPPFPHGSRL